MEEEREGGRLCHVWVREWRRIDERRPGHDDEYRVRRERARNYWRLYIAMQFSRRGMSLWVGSPLSNSLFDPYALPKILWPLLKQPRFLFASFLWPWSCFSLLMISSLRMRPTTSIRKQDC